MLDFTPVRAAAFLIASTIAAAAACSKKEATEAPGCRSVMQVVGPQHQALKTGLLQTEEVSPDTLTARAADYEKAAGELKALPLTDATLRSHAIAYAGVLSRGAQLQRDRARASGVHDPTSMLQIQAAVVSFSVDEMKALGDLQVYCPQ